MKTRRTTHPNPLAVAASLLCELTCRELLKTTAFTLDSDARDRSPRESSAKKPPLSGFARTALAARGPSAAGRR